MHRLCKQSACLPQRHHYRQERQCVSKDDSRHVGGGDDPEIQRCGEASRSQRATEVTSDALSACHLAVICAHICDSLITRSASPELYSTYLIRGVNARHAVKTLSPYRVDFAQGKSYQHTPRSTKPVKSIRNEFSGWVISYVYSNAGHYSRPRLTFSKHTLCSSPLASDACQQCDFQDGSLPRRHPVPDGSHQRKQSTGGHRITLRLPFVRNPCCNSAIHCSKAQSRHWRR